MAKHPAALIFSMCFGVAYVVCFYFNWALFRFYPAYNQFSIRPLGPEAGPFILWYGWMAWAFIFSAAMALIIPRSLAARVNPGLVWGISAALLVAIMWYEKRWFI